MPNPLDDKDLPGLFQAADSASLSGQNRFLALTRIRLSMAVIAAGFSVIAIKLNDVVDLAALLVALAFLTALGIETGLLVTKPDETWYNGRAIAESTKTLAWRFAVGAEPFPKTLSEPEREFTDQLQGLLKDVPDTGIDPSSAAAISPSMRKLRAGSLSQRRSSYLKYRIVEQRDWYGRQATWNRKRGSLWTGLLIIGEFTGVCLGVSKGVGFIDFDASSIVAAAVGSGAAWLGVKQHNSLFRAYTFANLELSIVQTRLEAIHDENRWSTEVADAEEAISREHTMWRASRSRLLPQSSS